MKNIEVFASPEELSDFAAACLVEQVKKNPSSLLCLASGGSPAAAYRKFTALIQEGGVDSSRMRVIKLDEWLGIPMDDPGSCEYFLQKTIVEPLGIDPHRYFSFSTEKSPGECRRMDEILRREGPADITVLGLGLNGHLGFNEPGDTLSRKAHITPLSRESLSHPMLASLKQKPQEGISLGMEQIMQSRRILLLVHGGHKAEILKQWEEGPLTTRLPASWLHLHPQAELFRDKESRPRA